MPFRCAAREHISEPAPLIARPFCACIAETVDDKTRLVVAGHETYTPRFLELIFHRSDFKRRGNAGEQKLMFVMLDKNIRNTH